MDAFCLVHNPQNKQMVPILLTIPVNGRIDPVQHKGEEFAYILEGHLQLTLYDPSNNTKEIYHLNPGDAIYYKSSLQRTWKNHSNKEGRCLIAKTPPSIRGDRGRH